MKFNKWTLALIALLSLVFVAPVKAQVTNGMPNLLPINFFQSAEGYFTSLNTNNPASPQRVEIFTGIDQAKDLSADFGAKVTFDTNWFAEAIIQNADVLGTVQAIQGGGGYQFVDVDTELGLGLDVGDEVSDSRWFAEPYGDVRKYMTANTFSGLRLYYPIYFSGSNKASAPGVLVETGFKF